MRHRASRPIADLWHRLPRAAAYQLEKAAQRVPARTLAIVMVVAGLGVGGYVVGSVIGGSSAGQTETALDTSSREPEQPPLTSQLPESADQSRAGSRPEPSASSSGQPQAPPPTSEYETPSLPTEMDELTDSPSTRGESPYPRPSEPGAASRTADDTRPPNTSLSEEHPEPDEAQFSFSANETASFTCSLDESAYSSCDSPTLYSDLDPGWHTFSVRATDADGNVDPSPAETRWRAKGGSEESKESEDEFRTESTPDSILDTPLDITGMLP
jgi:hypothetical protein